MKFWGASVMQRAAEEKSGFLEQETREEIQEIETRMEEVMHRRWKYGKPGGIKMQMAQVGTDDARVQHVYGK